MTWYKNKLFWRLLVIQGVVALVLGWFFAAPLFEQALEYGGASSTPFTWGYFLFVYFTAVWVTQCISFALYPRANLLQQIALLIGAYVQVSLPVVLTLNIMNRCNIQARWLRYFFLFLGSLFFWKLLRELFALYFVVGSELYFRVLV